MDYLDKMMGFENGDLGVKDILELFSELIASGTVWKLQGSYGRSAAGLIENGLISATGEILPDGLALCDDGE